VALLREFFSNLLFLALHGFEDMIMAANNLLTAPLDSWGAVLNIATTVISPFALLIIGICLLIEIAQVASKVDLMKWEYGIKLGFKMAVSVAMLNILPTFLAACYYQAVAWINGVADLGPVGGMGSMFHDDLRSMIDGVSGFWTVFGLFATTNILVLAIHICGLLVLAIAFGRMFEIYVYLAISPLPAAFFPLGDGTGGGFSRITMKFLRSFAAVCLQGVMMMICMRLFSILIRDVLDDAIYASMANGGPGAVIQVIFMFLMGSIALVMGVVKSGSWAKSILDAV